MKIDQDLRAAIRSAEKSQPSQNRWEVKEIADTKSIADFMKRFPAKAKAFDKLAATIARYEAAEAAARKEMCDTFGLRIYDKKIQFSQCGDGKVQFKKAGGKLLNNIPGVNWTFDGVMAELAAAEPKQLTAILKKYGINWK